MSEVGYAWHDGMRLVGETCPRRRYTRDALPLQRGRG